MKSELKRLIALEDVQQEAYDTLRSRVEHDGENPDDDQEVKSLFEELVETQDRVAELEGEKGLAVIAKKL